MPTQDQIAAYIEKELGLQREDKYSWGNKYLSVTDVEAGSDNALVGFDGKLYFIDPLIRLKQPAYKVIESLTGIDVEKELHRQTKEEKEKRTRTEIPDFNDNKKGNRLEKQAHERQERPKRRGMRI